MTPEEQFPDEISGNVILIYDQLEQCTLSVYQYKVVNAVMRQSYGRALEQIADGTGDGRMAIVPSYEAFAKRIGLTVATFQQVVNELVAVGVLVVDGQQVGFNMQFDQWRMDIIGSKKRGKS